MTHHTLGKIVLSAICSLAVTATAAQPVKGSIITDTGSISKKGTGKSFKKPGYSPYAGRHYPTRILWGDQHLHTAWSADAAGGGTTLEPNDAYAFARGDEVISSTGQPVRLARPLDWLAVTDHSDAMGVINEVMKGNAKLMADPILKRWNKQMNAGGEEAMKAVMEMISRQGKGTLPKLMMDPTLTKDIWRKNTSIAETYNDPGKFTAFIAYEWSSNAGGGDNLHRNIIYRDGKMVADQVAPLTTFDSENPEDLWTWMQGFEDKTGGSLLAIPHNGNLSNGRMFSLKSFEGNALTKDWADARRKWERLYEVTQNKGTSETHPSLSPNDEFADFEIWDKGNLNVVPKKPGDINTEYIREAYKNGLKIKSELGSNPFMFGMAGGTDQHTGLTAVEEDNYFGKFPSSEPKVDRWSEDAYNFDGRVIKGWELGSSGRTAVWASENTREAIWDAMQRKETYATTGTRIGVRFFGSFDFVPEDGETRQLGIVGYEKGVPMGGNLSGTKEGTAPSFLVAAIKDPIKGNLDRIQIVKGWLSADGKTHEKVYNVVWSDPEKRKKDAKGKVPAVGSTVDVANATWTNTIGAPELVTLWKDPDFKADEPSFYYARVLEIPTPRWTAYDAKRFAITMSKEVPMSLQERAFTTPIWYTPAGK